MRLSSSISPVAASFGLAVAAAVSTGLGAYWSTRAVAQATEWVAHTQEVRRTLEEVLSLVKDAETGQRGFILTGDPAYLQPYLHAHAQVRGSVDHLTRLTADNPAQQQRVATLRGHVVDKLYFTAEAVELMRSGNQPAAVAAVASGRGNRTMDRARADVEAMQAEEDRLLRQRMAQADDARSRGATVAALTTTLLLGLITTVYLTARRSNERIAGLLQESEASRRDLRDSQALMQAVADGASALVFVKDLEGRYFLTNRAWQRVTGHSQHQAYGLTDVQVFGPELGSRLAAADREVVAHGEGRVYEETAVVRGRPVTYLTSKFPLRDDQGQVFAVAGMSADITELKTAREEVERLNADLEQRVQERTRQLSEANEQLEAFSYSVSHDLRAPLRGLQGFAQAVQEDYADRLDADGRDYLNRIMAAARRMEGLIQDLLEYGRLSRQEVQLRPLSLQVAVTETLAQMAPELERSGAQVQVVGPLPSVQAHSAVLLQVVANLLGNALKFTRPGESPSVRVWAEAAAGRVRTFVQDQGIGIQAEHRERIFQVFERLHGQEAYPGTGVGLAIVRKGCERMLGSCGIESVPGKGSTFWFELQAAKTA